MTEILLCNLKTIPDKKYEILGLVSVIDYDRRDTKNSLDAITIQAKNLNADAIINIKFSLSAHDHHPVILVCGTAIKFIN